MDTNAAFERELARRGLAFERQSEDNYGVWVDGREVIVNLANARRNAERDRAPRAIRQFVEQVIGVARASTPDWRVASGLLLFSAEAAEEGSGDVIEWAVTERVSRVLTLTDAEQSRVSWVTPAMCMAWGVTPDQAAAAASTNQDALLQGLELEVSDAGGEPLGMLPLHSPYKASLIFAPDFKRLVAPALGWPVLAIIPCRDFIYVLRDNSPLLGRIGLVVIREYRGSGYPITTEVLRISDDGITGIGAFPA